MLRKGVLTIIALVALSLAVELARSHTDHPVSSATAYMSKTDFDRVFANFDRPSDKSSLAAVKTKREMLRREGMVRANSATKGEQFVLVKTRIVDSHVALSLYGIDETLCNRDLSAPVTFVLSDLETPLISSSEVGKLEPASAGSAALAPVAFLVEPSPSNTAMDGTLASE